MNPFRYSYEAQSGLNAPVAIRFEETLSNSWPFWLRHHYFQPSFSSRVLSPASSHDQEIWLGVHLHSETTLLNIELILPTRLLPPAAWPLSCVNDLTRSTSVRPKPRSPTRIIRVPILSSPGTWFAPGRVHLTSQGTSSWAIETSGRVKETRHSTPTPCHLPTGTSDNLHIPYSTATSHPFLSC